MSDSPRPPTDAAPVATGLRVVLGKLKRRLREQINPGDLSWSQLAVLGLLEWNGPATVTTLAKAEGVRPQSMSATVAALEAAGMVRGEADPTDGRQTLLSLTPACRAWIETTRAAREDWLLSAIQTRLTPQEQDTLAQAVDLLERLVAP